MQCFLLGGQGVIEIYHVSIMELVIWMQINLPEILGWDPGWSSTARGLGGSAPWKPEGSQRGSASTRNTWDFLSLESGLMSCGADITPKTLHCYGVIGVSLSIPLMPVPNFHWEPDILTESFWGGKTPFQLSFLQSHDCHACKPGWLSICSCLQQPMGPWCWHMEVRVLPPYVLRTPGQTLRLSTEGWVLACGPGWGASMHFWSWAVSLLKRREGGCVNYGLSASQSSFAKSVGMRECAVLAQGSLCQTGYKPAFLNGPGIAVIGVGDGNDGRGTPGNQKGKSRKLHTCVCLCVSKNGYY